MEKKNDSKREHVKPSLKNLNLTEEQLKERAKRFVGGNGEFEIIKPPKAKEQTDSKQ